MAVAARHGRHDLLRALLTTGIVPTTTVLLNAVIAGRVESASVLLWRGLDPNAMPHASAPLWAFCPNHGAMITLLARRGVDLEARWEHADNSTALVRAALYSDRRYVVALLRCGASTTHFERDLAVSGGSSALASQLVAAGPDPMRWLCGVGNGEELRLLASNASKTAPAACVALEASRRVFLEQL